MSLQFHSDESDAIRQRVFYDEDDEKDEFFYKDSHYTNSLIMFSVDTCVEWIRKHGFSKIALQFPHGLLNLSARITARIAEQSGKSIYILADTAYGSCCVDEIAAQHASADAIIHFGHACLSPTERLPVLYVFGDAYIDVEFCSINFSRIFSRTRPVIIYYEVWYQHAIAKIAKKLIEWTDLVFSELVIPGEEPKTVLQENEVRIVKNQRYFNIPKSRDLKDYAIYYIGCREKTFTNVMLSLSKCTFYQYNPRKIGDLDTVSVNPQESLNKFLKKRYYYIEKTRDAKRIGILVGTLGVLNYSSTIKRLREAIAAANKKSYVIATGKKNVAKLANFVDIDIYVNVACLESSIVDCTGYLQPVITPYELEIALNVRIWSDDYVIDFAELLPDGSHHVPIGEIKMETDVSLITGQMRSIGTCDTSDDISDESSALVERNDMTVAELHSQAAGEFLTQRSWRGLEQNLGETPIADIQEGRRGIASGYEDEKDGCN